MFSPSQDSVKGVAGHLEQGNIKVCSGVPYQITYDLGRGGDNLPYNCNVALFITGGSSPFCSPPPPSVSTLSGLCT